MRRTLDLVALTLGISLLLLAVSCNQRSISSVEPTQNKQVWTEFPIEFNNNLDILFVIDDSGSMLAEQQSLADNFVRIIDELATLEDGVPNLHIGVVSTNMGAGRSPCGGSAGLGDNGTLQNLPRVSGCTPPDGYYISNLEGEVNYTGSMADAFACIAQLGTDGCGFEQPLAAMQRALDGSNPTNSGFLRDGARLAVIFITDEDDCSTQNTFMFDAPDDPESPVGAYKSFRCFEFGVECLDVEDPRQLGTRTECVPMDDSPYMNGVDEYISFIEGLKRYPASEIMIAGIVGDSSPITIVEDRDGDPCLFYSCGTATDCGHAGEDPGAVPPIRLQAFIDAFTLNYTSTLCSDDLTAAVQEIAEWMRNKFDGRCLDGMIPDADPEAPGIQPECVVSATSPEGVETVLPLCDNSGQPEGSSNLPCYGISVDEERCSEQPTHLRVDPYYPDGQSVAPSTMIRAFCVAE